MARGDLIQGFLWFGIGIAVTCSSTRYPLGSLSEPGPAAMPFGLGLILIALSVIFLVRAQKLRSPVRPFGKRYPKIAATILLLCFCTLAIDRLGYLLSVFLVLTVAMLIFDKSSWFSALLLGTVSSAASYALFSVWLKVPLPKGLLSF